MAFADELLGGLAGHWRLAREVVSASGVPMARMDGLAAFSPEGASAGGVSSGAPCLRYREEGEMVLAGGDQPVIVFSRGYRYRAWERGLDIAFDEDPERPFQRVVLALSGDRLEGTAEHLCAPDTYRSRYRFALPAGFEIIHEVAGPRKGYVIRSSFRRPD